METTHNYKKHTSRNPLHRFLLEHFFNTMLAMIDGRRVSTILDVGCGEGFTLDRLEKAGIGKKLEGIDPLNAAIAIGREIHPDLNIKKGDIYNLQYKDNSFDLVLCNEVMEHLDDPLKGYHELLRVSKKYVLISVPHEPFFTLQRFARFQNVWKLGFHPEHINLWSYFGFKRFLRRGNVIVVERRMPFPWQMALVEKAS